MARKGLSWLFVSIAPGRGPHSTAFHKDGGAWSSRATCHLLLSHLRDISTLGLQSFPMIIDVTRSAEDTKFYGLWRLLKNYQYKIRKSYC